MEENQICIRNKDGDLLFTISEGTMAQAGKDDYYGFWINRGDGEGALFPAEQFIPVLEKFYNDNF